MSPSPDLRNRPISKPAIHRLPVPTDGVRLEAFSRDSDHYLSAQFAEAMAYSSASVSTTDIFDTRRAGITEAAPATRKMIATARRWAKMSVESTP